MNRHTPPAPPRRRRKFKLAALVARKIEEHSKLARDAMRLAIALALVFAGLLAANAFYTAWKDDSSPPPPLAKLPR